LALSRPQAYKQVEVSLDQEQHDPSSDTKTHSSQQTQPTGCKTYLVTEGMTTDDNRVDPARNGTRNPLEDDGFTENSSSENITDLSKFKMLVHRYWDGKHTVPLGLFHMALRLNSFTRASSGVIVAHLMPTLYF